MKALPSLTTPEYHCRRPANASASWRVRGAPVQNSRDLLCDFLDLFEGKPSFERGRVELHSEYGDYLAAGTFLGFDGYAQLGGEAREGMLKR